MTLVIRMKTTIDNASAPSLVLFDPIESRTGSLFLWDAGLMPLGGVPPIGSVLPNVLADFPVAANNDFIFAQGNQSQATHDAYLAREMTNKGALHLMASQSRDTDIAGTCFYGLQSNVDLRNALYNNIMGANPSIYVSMWSTTTRYVTGTGYAGIVAYLNSNTTNFATYLQSDKNGFTLPTSVAGDEQVSKLGLTNKQSEIVGQPNYYQASLKGYNGTGVASTSDLLIGAGVMSPWSGTVAANQALNSSPSLAIYRIYIEDTALSGRSFAEIKAIDDAEFAKAFGVGGRFYNDTWSDPSVVIP